MTTTLRDGLLARLADEPGLSADPLEDHLREASCWTWPDVLGCVLAVPDSDPVRLMAARWLEEDGQKERAEFVRVQVELAGLAECRNVGTVDRAYTNDRGEVMADVTFRECGCRWHTLRRRERELLDARGPFGYFTNRADWFYRWRRECEVSADHPGWVYRRGFVDEVRLPAASWLAHADAIVAATPVRAVRLTDRPTFSPPARVQMYPPVWEFDVAGRLVRLDERDLTAGREPATRFDALPLLLSRRWPGVEFELPPDASWGPSPLAENFGQWATTTTTPLDDLRAMRRRLEEQVNRANQNTIARLVAEHFPAITTPPLVVVLIWRKVVVVIRKPVGYTRGYGTKTQTGSAEASEGQGPRVGNHHPADEGRAKADRRGGPANRTTPLRLGSRRLAGRRGIR